MTKYINSTAPKHSALKQVCSHNPAHALAEIVRKHRAEDLARTLDYWSDGARLWVAWASLLD